MNFGVQGLHQINGLEEVLTRSDKEQLHLLSDNGLDHAIYPLSVFGTVPGQDYDVYTRTHLPHTMGWSGSPIPSTILPTTEICSPASTGPSAIDIESPGPSGPVIFAEDSTALCKCLGCLVRLGSFLCHDRFCQLPCETSVVGSWHVRREHACLLGCGEKSSLFNYEVNRKDLRCAREREHKHIATHFLNEQKQYQCKEEGCKTIVKRWAELPRHYKTAHCLVPDNFPCDVSGCKYGGENGFKRHDKLTSHKKTHKGPGVPAQQLQKRLLMPKV